jgi:hypothetical protein
VLVSSSEGCIAPGSASALAKSAELAPASSPAALHVPPRLPTESEVTYRRFLAYLVSGASGRRSFTAVAEQFGVAESVVREQARRYQWLERAAAADRATIARELSAGMDVQRRSIIAQVQLGERLVRVLEGIVDELEASSDESALDRLPAALDATKTLQRVQQALRVALDMPTATTRSEVAVAVFDAGTKKDQLDYSLATDAEMELLNEAEKVKAQLRERSRG